jgi:hypothetical protein
LLREAMTGLVIFSAELFAGCTVLTSVALIAHVSVIKESAFTGCSALQRIDLSLSQSGRGGLAESSLIQANASRNLRHIPDKAFKGCASLVSVRLPQQLGQLEVEVCVGCTLLRTLAVSDVECSAEPVGLLGEKRLEQLELIGWRFDNLPVAAASGWLADEADVVSASFVGQRWVDSRSGLSDDQLVGQVPPSASE